MTKRSAKQVSVKLSAALFCVAIAVTCVVAQDALVPTLEIDWNTIDSGGGESAALGFSLAGTIAQIDAPGGVLPGGATMAGGGFEFSAGFWHGVQHHCVADVAPAPPPVGTGGDGLVNAADLLAMLAHYGSADALYDIAPPGGDGIVNVQELLLVIAAWGVCP